MSLNDTLAAITGLPDPLRERPASPLDVLASADRDVRINTPRLLRALSSATTGEAWEFACTLHLHRVWLEELEGVARARAGRVD